MGLSRLPEATVTLVTAAGTVDYAINGGDLGWGFDIPQATVTLVAAAGPVDHTVDGGNAVLGLPSSEGRLSVTLQQQHTSWKWTGDNDGSYGNSRADVWPRGIEGTFRCKRGPQLRQPANRP